MALRQFGLHRLAFATLRALGLLLTAGCIESSAYDKATVERDQALYAIGQRDRQLRALEWQLGYVGQQIRAMEQRDQGILREMSVQIEDLKAQNRALSERLAKEESRKAERPKDPAPESTTPGGKPRRDASSEAIGGRARAEDLGKLERLINTQHAQVIEMLVRIEKLVRSRDGKPGDRPDGRGHNLDVLDPWGYGDRK